MNWEDVRFFVAATREGSLTKAGKALGVEHTTVARRLNALEEQLGARLIERLRTGIVVTEAGKALLARAIAAEQRMIEIERLAGTFDGEQRGRVVLATSGVLASGLIVPMLQRLHQTHPGIDLHVEIGRHYIDLTKREADLALRLRPRGARVAADGDVVVKRIAQADFGLYASDTYLRAHPPFSLEALSDHGIIRYGVDMQWEPGRSWLLERVPTPRTAVVISDMMAVREACAAGLGLAFLPHFHAVGFSLRRLASGCDGAGIHLAVHPDLRKVPRVRAVYDWLSTTVKQRFDSLAADA